MPGNRISIEKMWFFILNVCGWLNPALVGKVPIIEFETIEQILKFEARHNKAETKFKTTKTADVTVVAAKNS